MAGSVTLLCGLVRPDDWRLWAGHVQPRPIGASTLSVRFLLLGGRYAPQLVLTALASHIRGNEMSVCPPLPTLGLTAAWLRYSQLLWKAHHYTACWSNFDFTTGYASILTLPKVWIASTG